MAKNQPNYISNQIYHFASLHKETIYNIIRGDLSRPENLKIDDQSNLSLIKL